MIFFSFSLAPLPINVYLHCLSQEKEIMKEIMDNGPVQGKANSIFYCEHLLSSEG